MTTPSSGEQDRWVDGTLESGADDEAGGQVGGQDGGREEPPQASRGAVPEGEPNTFEPEEDPSPS